MKTEGDCYKNPEFREHHIKNYTVERTGGKALGTVQDIDRPSEQGV